MTSTPPADSNTSSSSDSAIVRDVSSFTAEENDAREAGDKSNDASSDTNEATLLSNDPTTSQQD